MKHVYQDKLMLDLLFVITGFTSYIIHLFIETISHHSGILE